MLYEEEDEEWVVEVGATKGSGLVRITSASRLATEVRLRKELLGMYEANGWTHLAENEKMGLVVRFP